MKAVLISIRPEWCQLIAGGQKTVEVRKNRPKLETPFKCYIYCTNANTKDPREVLEIHGADGKIRKANGHVIGEFVCDSCTLLSKAHYGYIRRCAGIRKEALKEYMGIPEGEELSYLLTVGRAENYNEKCNDSCRNIPKQYRRFFFFTF